MRNSVLVALLSGSVLAAPAHGQSLDSVIDATLEHSPTLAAARARADAAAAKVDEARGARLPQIDVNGQLGYGRIDPQGFFNLPADNVTPRTAALNVELPLFTGGRLGAAKRQAEGGEGAANSAVEAARLALRVQAVKAYADELGAQKRIASYSRMIDALTETLRQAKLMFTAGNGTSTDVAQAEARLAQAQAGLAATEGDRQSALTRLKTLTGKSITPDAELPGPPPVPATIDEAVAQAMAHNPQLAQSEAMIKSAKAGLDGARAERLPSVSAYAEASTVRDQFFPGYKADSTSAGVRLRWKLFSGGQTSARERGAAANLEASKHDYQAARDMIEQQATQGFETVRAARAVFKAAEARASASDSALRSTRLEVQSGAKPQLALLDAEREAIDAESSRISAQGNLLIAAYSLRAIAGMDEATR
ncbi:MAG: TolC family protein [Sphingomonadaceae bacterium]